MITIKGVDPRMIANNITPFEPIHPGELLKDEIEYRGISQRKLARQSGIAYSALNDIMNLKRPITAEIAILLEAALGIEAEMLIKMQTGYNMQVARNDKKMISKTNDIRKLVACL
jgi:addiction module HigA family antidote